MYRAKKRERIAETSHASRELLARRRFRCLQAASDVGPFQVGLLAYVKSNHPKVLEDIAAQGQLSPELDGQIKDIMTKYTAEYSA